MLINKKVIDGLASPHGPSAGFFPFTIESMSGKWPRSVLGLWISNIGEFREGFEFDFIEFFNFFSFTILNFPKKRIAKRWSVGLYIGGSALLALVWLHLAITRQMVVRRQ